MEGEGEVVTTGVTAPFTADMRSGGFLFFFSFLVPRGEGGGGSHHRSNRPFFC